LTIYVLGLSVTSPKGISWLLSPHLSGLAHAEGGFETALGWFGASWKVAQSGGTTSLTVNLDVPAGTSGVFKIPSELLGTAKGVSISVDGKVAKISLSSEVTLTGGKHVVLATVGD
jgi:hypothetical protein